MMGKYGKYLGLLDLTLLCNLNKKEAVIAYWEPDEPLRLQSLPCVLSRQFNEAGDPDLTLADLWPEIEYDGQWYLVCCRADFKRDQHYACNHWLPAFHKDQLGEDWSVRKLQAAADLQDRILEQTKVVTKVTTEQEDSDEEADDQAFASALEYLSLLESQQAWFQQLAESDLVAEEVPADGDCGLWSVLALQAGEVGSRNVDAAREAMKGARLMLKNAWLDVSEDPVWQTFFRESSLFTELGDEILDRARKPSWKDPRELDPDLGGDDADPAPSPSKKPVAKARAARFGKPQSVAKNGLKKPQPKKPKNKGQQKQKGSASISDSPEKPSDREEEVENGSADVSCLGV